MKSSHHRWHSPALGQDMELRVYGQQGKPVLVFPCQGGRFFEYEDFGMVEALRPNLEAGKIRLITVDSVDNESWLNESLHPNQRALRHDAYDRYIVSEVVPFIQRETGRSDILVTGNSMGGYHSANFFFRHPHHFDAVVAISGVYRLKLFIGDYMDEAVYYHVPLAYLPGLTDPVILERYRNNQIVLCVGQGAWEDDMLEDTRQLQGILQEKQVPAWIDIWGHDVNHDWPWWRKMVPYFFEKLGLGP